MQQLDVVSARIRVLCVDDSEEIPALLGQCIAAESDMECAGCLHDASDLVDHVRALRADIVLLDLHMPGKNPLEALSDLAATLGSGAIRVIAYSGDSSQVTIDRAIVAGAWGYLSKDAEIESVLAAIRTVAGGNMSFGT